MIRETKNEENVGELNKACDKLITELKGISLRIAVIQRLTAYHGPSIDAERNVHKAIKCLEHQKR